MLKRLENKLRMFQAVKQVLDRNSGIWQGITALVAIVNEFFEKMNQITETRKVTESSSKGATAGKNTEEELLVDTVFEVSSALYAMAVRSGNAALQQKVKFTEGELQTAREGELATIGETIAALARENLEALAEYGVDDARVKGLEDSTARFKELISTPRADIAQRKAAQARLKELFIETSGLLTHQLDRLLIKYRSSHPDFYAAYMNARVIVDHGIRHEKPEEPEGE